jgi:hypothetical protein
VAGVERAMWCVTTSGGSLKTGPLEKAVATWAGHRRGVSPRLGKMSDDLVVCALLAIFFDGRRAPCSGRVGSRKTRCCERRGAWLALRSRRPLTLTVCFLFKGMGLPVVFSFVAAGK